MALKQTWKKSPFAKPRTKKVTLAVVHSMAENLKLDDGPKDAHSFLLSIKLGAHSLLTPDGTHIRMADTNDQLSHAKGFNQISFGIEFLVPGVHDYDSFLKAIADTKKPPYTEAQYASGGEWLALRCKEHGLTWDNVKGHVDIDPTRKFDPGKAFDWAKLKHYFDATF